MVPNRQGSEDAMAFGNRRDPVRADPVRCPGGESFAIHGDVTAGEPDDAGNPEHQ